MIYEVIVHFLNLKGHFFRPYHSFFDFNFHGCNDLKVTQVRVGVSGNTRWSSPEIMT